ncbi:pyruvate phosphate dikinase PEP/pyruvate-binding protein [Aphanothece hegewaldii CCALA 016]|uniref:Pyruvate phosphate dikinase PEP/pyruvate-binding protein n=1 Tax=Aphanothece hegewaldii CCALA 016 TaxID=2107694 RepID=A0A2T1M077_9CHRO|nr:glycerol-3-phosphate acyltransferase [Aphanothece hegewaldii]PSF38088.1 pyruvate phosphate dikinase PEP/pyruvate-binding protein [Aphanothece hegewaldii CCALA 016]
MSQVWGLLIILIICPLLGGLPLIDWITYGLSRKRLSKIGTRNISVSAAFYHGGQLAGIFAVVSEAAKGILTILLTRVFFPSGSVWELFALCALVLGRYWWGKGAGTTNVFWGVMVHDPIGGSLTLVLSLISFTLFRDRKSGKLVVLFLLALILTLRHANQPEYIIGAIALAALLAGIYQKIPDDLDLSQTNVNPESKKMFRFFRGEQAILSLNDSLKPQKVGQKAATLSHLKRLGYAIPDGWVLPAGDDIQSLISFLNPSITEPLAVRSSAIGEDSENASAAGQYISILNITNKEELESAILACQNSYNSPTAIRYRQDRQQKDTSMTVLIQKQIKGVFSGVAFSRDPVEQLNTNVVIEALPGDASLVVSGKVTPERYQIEVSDLKENNLDEIEVNILGEGDVPLHLIKQVAILSRQLEDLYQGKPQDIEWTYDGQTIWLLQSRAITNLHPIWTRKIAAEVIPGVIHPLTWSINQPLTCGVWGDIFQLVLGKRAQDLDFNQTATLHFQRAYFNASLLNTIFQRMGLPPESLEFLTRGAKLSKPSVFSTLINLPGLLRLAQREWQLEKDFEQDKQHYFIPTLQEIEIHNLTNLSSKKILNQIEQILLVLKKATYYSILTPLSFAIRQAILKVPFEDLDNSAAPEVASVRSLAALAEELGHLLPIQTIKADNFAALFAHLSEVSEGKNILNRFQKWLECYGYLGEVGTDIAVPRWSEEQRPVKELFFQFLFSSQPFFATKSSDDLSTSSWPTLWLQKRLNLKNQTTEIYSKLLSYLRWHFVALEENLMISGRLNQTGDIFFLKYDEIEKLTQVNHNFADLIQQRRQEFQQNKDLTQVPYVVYGKPNLTNKPFIYNISSRSKLQGIGASPGQKIGIIKIVKTLQNLPNIDAQTILVVPYTDSGWSAILSRAGGIIAEVGGRLSHGAIIAREYGIPAVMDVHHATEILKNDQLVRIDGQKGLIEILDR